MRLNGSKATFEVVTTFVGESARRCANGIEAGRLNCLIKNRGTFTSAVTCHVNNWHKLDDRTGNRISLNNEQRWHNSNAWDHVAVQGTISHAEDKAIKFGAWGGSGGSFGLGGGYHERGFIYRSIHLNNCRLLTYRNKAVVL